MVLPGHGTAEVMTAGAITRSQQDRASESPSE